MTDRQFSCDVAEPVINVLASTFFGRLRKTIWSNRKISMKLKMRLFRAQILTIAIYASETLVLTVKEKNKLNVFDMRCLKSILDMSRRDRISNTNIRKSLNAEHTITDHGHFFFFCIHFYLAEMTRRGYQHLSLWSKITGHYTQTLNN